MKVFKSNQFILIFIKGMFQIDSENYNELKSALKELLLKLECVKEVNLNKKNYEVQMTLGGDMKCIALLMGINAANSKQACLWCKCDLKKAVNLDEKWPFSRSQDEANLKFQSNLDGYKYEPIIKFIDFNNVIIDMLHLLLRITDQLFICLLEKLIRYDLNDSIDLNQRELFSILENFLKFNCKLTKPFRYTKVDCNNDNMLIKFRSFNGNERLKIFQALFEEGKNFEDLFCNIDVEFDLENYVWKEFFNIYMRIKAFDNQDRISKIDLDNLKHDLKKWLEFYIILSGKENITPYVHAFVFHVPEFLERFGQLNLYNVQGLEKINDLTTHYYHTSTNKHNVENEYLIQLLKKQNRLEFYNLDGHINEII